MGWSFKRRLISRTANLLTRFFLKMSIHDCTSGFRCYNLNVIEKILLSLRSSGYEIQVETLFNIKKNGFSIFEVPITFVERQHGKSKLDFREIYKYAKQVQILFNRVRD